MSISHFGISSPRLSVYFCILWKDFIADITSKDEYFNIHLSPHIFSHYWLHPTKFVYVRIMSLRRCRDSWLPSFLHQHGKSLEFTPQTIWSVSPAQAPFNMVVHYHQLGLKFNQLTQCLVYIILTPCQCL